jgi:hypothetical protein
VTARVYLDVDVVDWSEMARILEEAFRTVAPKRLVEQLNGS